MPIAVENLTVRFDTVTALDRITHVFQPGTATAVMGVNGSGKTTLLESLAGMLRITSGRISGVPDRVAYICQHPPATWMPLTAGEVIAMGRYRERGLTGRFRAADRAAVLEAANHLEVAQLENRDFGSLSGGQQQRVRIAQALAAEPALILLDEPITGLDIPSQDRILAVIDEYAERGAVVIVTTHHLDEARHCHTVMLLANRLAAVGSPEDVLTVERLKEAFGPRVLGDHAHHDHDHDLHMLDDHGHGQHSPGR